MLLEAKTEQSNKNKEWTNWTKRPRRGGTRWERTSGNDNQKELILQCFRVGPKLCRPPKCRRARGRLESEINSIWLKRNRLTTKKVNLLLTTLKSCSRPAFRPLRPSPPYIRLLPRNDINLPFLLAEFWAKLRENRVCLPIVRAATYME